MVADPGRAKTTMSMAVASPVAVPARQWRKLSLTTRLIRFLPLAVLSTFFETAIPRRDFDAREGHANTRKQASEEAALFSKTLLKSDGFRRRAERGREACPLLWLSWLASANMITGPAVMVLATDRQVRQADRRFLPFARRALMMERPARVDMRARKPCLRARFRRLG